MNIHEPAAARTPCRSRESRLAQANIGDMPDVQAGAVTLPSVVAHADWSVERGKRLMAIARLVPGRGCDGSSYLVVSLAAAPDGRGGGGDVFQVLSAMSHPGRSVVGFDFPIGLPRRYAAAAGIGSLPEFLDAFGSPPWQEFDVVAELPGQITLRRPFYPFRPGGTSRTNLYQGLGLSATELRRRCEWADAETLFWTLGGKQVGKAALTGWRLLRQARQREPGIALWPFDGPLPDLLAGTGRVVVAETYPREYYRHLGAPARGQRWSKRCRQDRLTRVPGLLSWAQSLAVTWDAGVLQRVTEGFSDGRTGEDEFDAVVGLLAMIGVVTGTIATGEPRDDVAVLSSEGCILGRAS
jgi:hypothetical protein